MAGKSTTLAIRIVSDARGASRGFAEAESKVGGFQRGLDRASVAAGGVLAGMGAIAVQAFQAASDLQQSGGAIESVFGAQAAAVEDYAKRAAQAVGLSQNSYQELASVVGSQLGNMGIAQDQLVPKTNDLITLGSDLAATYGGTTSDAVAALSSLLRGETDPIERYGVSIKQADINARLAAEGMDGLEGPAAKAAQAQAVLGLLSDQTGASLGAFARESDTAAGAQQRAAAEFENAQAALGEALLPVVADAMEKLAGLSHWAQDNSGTVGALAIVIGGLAAVVLAVNAALTIYRTVATIATAAQWLFNTALLANPLFWIAAVVIGVVAGIVLLYQKCQPVRDAVDAVGRAFKWVFEHALWWVQPVVEIIQWLWDKLSAVLGFIGDVGSFVGDLFGGGEVVVTPGGGGGGSFGGPGGGFGGFGGGGLVSLGGGPGPAAVQASGGTTVNVYMDGLTVDGVATGRALVRVIEEYAASTGGRVAVQVGSRP